MTYFDKDLIKVYFQQKFNEKTRYNFDTVERRVILGNKNEQGNQYKLNVQYNTCLNIFIKVKCLHNLIKEVHNEYHER